jgi:hypothetical protein
MKTLLLMLTLFLPLSVFGQFNNEGRIQQSVKDARIVVVAEVLEIGAAPNVWSGLFAYVQRVRYKVIEVLKGEIVQPNMSVGHYIVKNSLTVDSQPRLSSRLFAKGNKLILFLAPDSGNEYIDKSKWKREPEGNEAVFVVPDPNYGALLADDANLNMVRNAILARSRHSGRK